MNQLFDAWLLFAATFLAVLVVRIAWFSFRGELSRPADWSATEKVWGRVAALGFAIAALVCGITAAYVSTRVPWVDNFPALLANPPLVVAGRQPGHISTASYLFLVPVLLGVGAAMLTDPWALQILRFRGGRALALRLLPVIVLVVSWHSLSRSIDALSAAIP